MAILLWILSVLIRWIRLKIYQYEVTFAVYMLTPTEKFIFSTSSPLFLHGFFFPIAGLQLQFQL